jgi:hypothetical protein
MKRMGLKTFQSTTDICGGSPKHATTQRPITSSNCDGRRFELKVLNGNQVKNPT